MAEFDELTMDEVELLLLAMEEKDKRERERDAGFFSVIASCTTGKSFSPADFIHDPEREAKRELVANDYAKRVSASRRAYEAMNGTKKGRSNAIKKKELVKV